MSEIRIFEGKWCPVGLEEKKMPCFGEGYMTGNCAGL